MLRFLIFWQYASEALPQMQATFSGKTRILPSLSRALRREGRLLGKSGLSFDNDCAAFSDDFFLADFISRIFYQVADFSPAQLLFLLFGSLDL